MQAIIISIDIAKQIKMLNTIDLLKNKIATARYNKAFKSSTKKSLKGIFALHFLHLPRKIMYDKIGMLSYTFIFSLQQKHVLGGEIKEMFWGNLKITTLEKLPNTAPTIKNSAYTI